MERDGPSVPLLASNSTEASPSSLSRKGCVASLSPLPPEVPVTREGFSLLGCPIGPPSFFEEVLQGRVTKLKESLGLLHEMGDSHLVATLLRSCFALPKFSYVIRTCPPSHVSQACWNVDCFTIRPASSSQTFINRPRFFLMTLQLISSLWMSVVSLGVHFASTRSLLYRHLASNWFTNYDIISENFGTKSTLELTPRHNYCLVTAEDTLVDWLVKSMKLILINASLFPPSCIKMVKSPIDHTHQPSCIRNTMIMIQHNKCTCMELL